MGNRVNRFRTAVSAPQMAQAIIKAWNQLFGVTPTKEQVAMVLAQNSLETGNRKSMWNYNVGNITTDGKGSYDFFDDLPTDEQIQPGVWKKMNLKYRAYPSLNEGAKDYLKFLSSKKYSSAWQNIIKPDPVAFSKALKSSKYYTANEAPYTKAITRLYKQFSESDAYDKAKSNHEKSSLIFDKSIPTVTPANDNYLINLLNKYLQIAASVYNKRIVKKAAFNNKILIKITSSHYLNSIEFARILCAVLEEELSARAYTYTDKKNVEVECDIIGPSVDCFNTIKQLTTTLQNTFKVATNKIGGLKVNTECLNNKSSSYNKLDYKFAIMQYRKFLLKFI